jgi:hypothetical protein
MQLVRADTGTIVTLPLVPEDPWPGALPVALAIPVVLFGALATAAAGLLGMWAPWVVGAAPILSLFLPLVWLVRRNRRATATLVFDAFGVRVVVGQRAPHFDAASMKAAVAWDRLSVEGPDERVELHLEPLDNDELSSLRQVLRELTQR